MRRLSTSPSSSLSALATVAALTFSQGCKDSGSGVPSEETPYSLTAMGDTNCGPIYPGESSEEGQLSGVFVLGDWAERVKSVLNSEGVTVKIFPEDMDPLVCYGSDGVTPEADGALHFNFDSPGTNRYEKWIVSVALPESVYSTYDAGYTDATGHRFENWELACFDQNSDSRPAGNYGYVFDEEASGEGLNLTMTGDSRGTDCDLRFAAP